MKKTKAKRKDRGAKQEKRVVPTEEDKEKNDKQHTVVQISRREKTNSEGVDTATYSGFEKLLKGKGKEGGHDHCLDDSCKLCFEDGKQRTCCKVFYCDYCYENKLNCPSCGIALDHGVPVRPTAKEDEQLKEKEVLECRRCLKPGYRRKCCQEYYCGDCYCKYIPLRIYVIFILRNGLVTYSSCLFTTPYPPLHIFAPM